MNRLITWARETLCRHEWRPTRFQALTGSITHECTKCGKWKYPI